MGKTEFTARTTEMMKTCGETASVKSNFTGSAIVLGGTEKTRDQIKVGKIEKWPRGKQSYRDCCLNNNSDS